MRHKPISDAPPHGRRAAGAARGDGATDLPTDPRNPGDEFLQREIDVNRRSELWLIPKAALALAIVAALIVVREVFFR